MSALRTRYGAPEALPLDVLLSMIPSLPRPVLHRFVDRAIDHMNAVDGDPDLELDGDELDGTMAEDDFHHQSANWLGHPGCPLSDPGGCEHDDREHEDWAFFEPLSRPPEGARKSREAHVRRIRRTRCIPVRRRHLLLREPKALSLRTMRQRHPQLRRKRRS